MPKRTFRLLPPGPPGRRFQEHFQVSGARRRPTKAVLSVAGATLAITGLVTYPIPGPPSTLMVLGGAALLGRASGRAARALDAMELRLRARGSLDPISKKEG